MSRAKLKLFEIGYLNNTNKSKHNNYVYSQTKKADQFKR